MAQYGASLYQKFLVYQVFGANTNVGKTIFSTIVCNAAKRRNQAGAVWYLKPVSTGPKNEADKWHLDRFAKGVETQNFYQFEEPISPHLAALTNIPDETLREKVATQISSNAQRGEGLMLVETAGGPHSPAPSGTSQADLYRPLRLPLLLVADWHLGGISTSISSFESLNMRGYDVEGVALFKEMKYQNYEYLQHYFRERGIPVLTASLPPPLERENDRVSMAHYYASADNDSNGSGRDSSPTSFLNQLMQRHNAKLKRLEDMAGEAHKHIWYPFCQHKNLNESALNVVDSAHGDYFQTYRGPRLRPRSQRGDENSHDNMLRPTVDGSASWWTQGLGHANSALTSSAAYAAGRYGHVMFAEGVHEPALSLAENLLSKLRNPRLNRVFYSDNGSTGMEVAVKMGLKAACMRYKWDAREQPLEIIGLQNSYHGDTIGAMDMSEPSVFNQQVPWYSDNGFWFDCPSVKMQNGVWRVEKPKSAEGRMGTEASFASLPDIFDTRRDFTEDAAAYEKFIRSTLEGLIQSEKRRFGSLVMEPVVLGSGGMILVDPLFQRILAKVVRFSTDLISPDIRPLQNSNGAWTGLPIIADEVFTGLYRLGHSAPASTLLRIHPDISTHAKLLTGGLLPLAATCASESIFEAFLSPEKSDCLLHGHSYTAHAVGCAVANTSLKQMSDLDDAGKWDCFKADWAGSGKPFVSELRSAIKDAAKNMMPKTPPNTAEEGTSETNPEPLPPIWSVWSTAFIKALSYKADRVVGVWGLGSVLSIELREDEGKGGYTSNAAKDMQRKLLSSGHPQQGWNIHSRVLGNVIYFMASQVSQESDVRAWESRIRTVIDIQ